MTGFSKNKKKGEYTRMHLGIYIVIPLNLLACLMPRPQSRLQTEQMPLDTDHNSFLLHYILKLLHRTKTFMTQ